MEEVKEEVKPVVKKSAKKKTVSTTIEQKVLSRMLDCDKCDLTIPQSVKIKKSFVDALDVFKDNPEHLSIVLEEALSLINIVKLSEEYSKKITK